MITARNTELARLMVEEVSRRIEVWLIRHGLILARQKAEMVVLTKRRNFPKPFSVDIAGHQILAADLLKYLGVTIDGKKHFLETNIQSSGQS